MITTLLDSNELDRFLLGPMKDDVAPEVRWNDCSIRLSGLLLINANPDTLTPVYYAGLEGLPKQPTKDVLDPCDIDGVTECIIFNIRR